jgi:hypothetical protein
MAIPRLFEIIQSFSSKAVNGISGFFRWAGDKTAGLRGGLKEKLDGLRKQTRLLDRLPVDRRIILTVAIGVPVILLLFIIGASLLAEDKSVKSAAPPVSSVITRRIPAEDIFLPDEPDFVPSVILEREKRTQWSADDAMPWWQDPLKDGEQEWRDQIEKTVDEIMESVP